MTDLHVPQETVPELGFVSGVFRSMAPHLWGYSRYYGDYRPLWLNQSLGRGNLWRQEIYDEFCAEGASCFWRALCFVAARQPLAAVHTAMRAGFHLAAPQTFDSAAHMVADYGFDVELCRIQANQTRRLWRVSAVRRPNGQQPRRRVVLVEHNDKGDLAPHWLPATFVRSRFPTPITLADRNTLDMRLFLPDLGAELFHTEMALADALVEMQRHLADVAAMDVEEVPDGPPVQIPEVGYRDVQDRVESSLLACVGVDPLPYMPACVVRYARFYAQSSAITDIYRYVRTKNKPGPFRRALFASGVVAWQLNPVSLIGANIRQDHVFYVRMAPPAVDDLFMTSGDYNPARFGSITTNRATYDLYHLYDVSVSKPAGPLTTFSVFGLSVRAHDLCRAFTIKIPFYYESDVVYCPRANYVDGLLPDPSRFPDRRCYLRACFVSLVSSFGQREPSLVATIQDQRNQVLALLEADELSPNYDPFTHVRAMYELMLQTKQFAMLHSVAGAAYSCA